MVADSASAAAAVAAAGGRVVARFLSYAGGGA